jgi:hypothetical protein
VPGLLEQYRAYKERQAIRLNIMGQASKGEQDFRANTLVGSGQERQLQSAREATRRVGEYKGARKEQELTEIMGILDQHSDKNFVQRIISPADYPKLYDNPGGEAGEPSTHSMAWGEDAQGNAFVYPTVVQGPNGNLQRLGTRERPGPQNDPWEAQRHAQETGELIKFGQDKETAAWFASDKGYKQIWDQP